MERHRHPADEILRRVALDYHFGAQGEQGQRRGVYTQEVPVNVYETENDVVVVAPMPGVEAGDIDIQVLDKTVTLRAKLRGPHQEDRQYLLHEWTYGPYERTIVLPIAVEAAQANATHNNGILAVSFPKSARSRVINVPLRHTGTDSGATQGHSGHGSDSGAE